jgi:hypothetical protein
VSSCRLWCVRSLRLFAAVVVLLAATWPSWSMPSSADAQESESVDPQKERMVKAVFLYGFGRYVEWPAAAFADRESPFVIGVLGDDPIGDTLDVIAKKKTILGRKIAVRRFASLDAFKEPCHILFVSGSPTSERQAAIFARLRGKSVFIVGETPGFAERGGSANFTPEGDHILFEINVDASRRSQLQVNSKLLSLAKARLVNTGSTEASN